MVTGTLVLAGLSWLAGQSSVEVVPINARNFSIPIHVDPSQRSLMKELILCVSADEGRTWQQTAAAKPDQESFTYYAPNDGVYWFVNCFVDLQDRQVPTPGPNTKPQLKIQVDTQKPAVRITRAERQGDDALVAWDIQEDHLDPATLKLEYRPAAGAGWSPAPISQATRGETRFRLGIPGRVVLRLRVQDTAGNAGETEAEIPAGGFTSPPAAPLAGEGLQFEKPPADPQVDRANFSQSLPPLPSVPRPASDPNYPGPGSGTNTFRPASAPAETASRPVATTEVNTFTPAAPAYGAPPTRAGSSPQQAVKIVNSTQLSLDYRLDKVGPSGVGEVELYVTEDNGHSWRLLTKDTSATPPLTAELPHEGVYGFTLIVRSKAGLGKPAPKSGDAPQMRVEVDTTPPYGDLWPPRPEPGGSNELVLEWTATDRNLAPTPIKLQWAERPGSWQTIAENLPNTGGDGVRTTGSYRWRLPPSFPDKVYLRLVVQDLAGNVNVAESRAPVLVDLSEPEANLTGILPASSFRATPATGQPGSPLARQRGGFELGGYPNR
jgi:hypothetical protein